MYAQLTGRDPTARQGNLLGLGYRVYGPNTPRAMKLLYATGGETNLLGKLASTRPEDLDLP